MRLVERGGQLAKMYWDSLRRDTDLYRFGVVGWVVTEGFRSFGRWGETALV
jgi:hypothetical protein